MTAAVQSVAHDELLKLVEERHNEVRAFVDWAERRECAGLSMYLANRDDIGDARTAASLYRDEWWGIVIFTCFGCLNSTRAVRAIVEMPVDAEVAEKRLASVDFASPKVGHHRIQQGLTGACKALIAACRHSNLLHEVLHTTGSFDDRYRHLLDSRLDRWGRTTCFDLLLRTGKLGIGGQRYEPEIAYLDGSTGPSKGFRAIWGREVTPRTAPWCEGLLHAWHRHWPEVTGRVGVRWSDTPYAPGDLENALCIYQESQRHASLCNGGGRRC